MWSFYFVILDFLKETLPWRNCKDVSVENAINVKTKCLENPEQLLWKTTTANIIQVRNIFNSIKSLEYGDRPNYEYIRAQLKELLEEPDQAGHTTEPQSIIPRNVLKL